MFKLLMATSALFISSSTVFAQDEKPFNGPYIGGELGILDSRAYYGGIAGYRVQNSSDWVFGLEGSVGKYDPESGDTFDQSFSEYSASVIAGKAMGNSLLFATTGINVLDSRFSSDRFGTTNSSDTGFKIGGGYEYKCSKNFSIRAKGEYLKHGSSADDLKGTLSVMVSF